MEQYLLGGYTRSINDGLYMAAFNTETGVFEHKSQIAPLSQPTYLCLDETKQLLFSVMATPEKSGVALFTRHHDHWHYQSQCLTTKVPGCHLLYHDLTQTLYVANYHEGSLDTYRYQAEQGTLSPLERIEHQGSSVHPNQNQSHVHFVGTNAQRTHLYVCDLGMDVVFVYQIQLDGTLIEQQRFAVPAGMGPRHLVMHPSLPLVYILGELDNSLLVAHLQADGSLMVGTKLNLLTEIPEDVEPASAAIRISTDGKFLYCSTRFVNVLTVLSLEQPDAPRCIQQVDTVGIVPRDFCLSTTEDYVLIAHQNTHHISVFARNHHTGQVTFLNHDFEAAECVCILPM